MIRVGVDPALNSPGAAITVGGRLIACARIKVPRSHARLEIGNRCDAVAVEIIQWVLTEIAKLDEAHLELVYERPQIYGVGQSEGDPNDLIPLATINGAVARALHPDRILAPLPREWCGGTSKNKKAPKKSSRWHRLSLILDDAEQALIPDQHDVIDAVALSLHGTDRSLATPRRVYPGRRAVRSGA